MNLSRLIITFVTAKLVISISAIIEINPSNFSYSSRPFSCVVKQALCSIHLVKKLVFNLYFIVFVL